MVNKLLTLFTCIIIPIVIVVGITPAPAHAYIDPGIGGLIFQFFGLIFFFFLGMWTGLFARIKSLFLKLFGKKSKPETPHKEEK